VEFLPERVRLVAAPGELRDVELRLREPEGGDERPDVPPLAPERGDGRPEEGKPSTMDV